MLVAALNALGAEPSQTVGTFYESAMEIEGVEARFAFVNRGQAWVVRRLGELLSQVGDEALRASICEMLDAHERNIESAVAVLERRRATRP